MLFIPLLFFLFLFITSLYKKRLDLGGFMAAMYMITSLFAVILHYMPSSQTLDDYSLITPGLLPTIMYCGVLSIALFPFFKLNTNERKPLLLIKNIKYFNLITYIYIGAFFILVFLLFDDIVYGILQQNLADLRDEVHTGDLTNALSRQKSTIGKLLGYGTATVGAGGVFMIPFFFYSICFLKNSVLHNLLLLISSLSTVLLGIIAIDRSNVILWGLNFVMSFFLFRPYLTRSAKRFIFRILFVIGGLMGLYLMVLTISRFGDADYGVKGSLFSYIGQPFLNFCDIWTYVEVKDISTSYLLPAINEFILNTEPSDHEIITNAPRYMRVNGFNTYYGTFILHMGQFLATVVVVVMGLFIRGVVNRINRKTEITFNDIMHLSMVGIIVLYGCIAYYYANYAATMNLAFMLFAISKFKYKTKAM